jgi:hypothetical protein
MKALDTAARRVGAILYGLSWLLFLSVPFAAFAFDVQLGAAVTLLWAALWPK